MKLTIGSSNQPSHAKAILTRPLRSTKEVAYKTLVRPGLEYAEPIRGPCSELRIGRLGRIQRAAACWTCRGLQGAGGVGGILDELEGPALEARGDRSSLLLFHKIHSGAVYIGKKTSTWPLLTV